ncbi:MAG: ABC transporter permease, partial [Hyphomicrobiales bacterium]|nr:ABC transporter permease [Hyphomicrobiales bacterium]
YQAQGRVDAELTNGADVAVTGTTSAPASDAMAKLAALPGVASSATMQHRYAYVGKDLQDLFGIDVKTIGGATKLADAFFGPGGARAALDALAKTPNGVLVSQETVNDYQLALGDPVRLRLQDATTHGYATVPFRFVGIVKEFPTAPKDSFLVANADYVAAKTGSNAREVALLRASGEPADLAKAARTALGSASTLRVTDVSSTAHLIGSSLTAVDLRRLGGVELAFAVAFAAMAAGLTLWLGEGERARGSAILLALGADRREIRAFLWSEGLVLVVAGVGLGAPLGLAAAWTLVRLLDGAFDPPPDALSWPVAYLFAVLIGTVVAMIAAVLARGLRGREWAVGEMRAGR